MLSKTQLKQLRKEIVLNSLFISDYENSFNIDANDVCIFFEGYFEDLCYILKDEIGEEEYNKLSSDNFYKKVFEKDNIDNLCNYYYSIEDPLF